MLDSIIRKSIGGGIHFTAVRDPRFKLNLLSVSFLNPISRRTASLNALVPMVLRRGCGPYPDMTALNRRLKELYGARLDCAVLKRGEIQLVTVLMSALNDGYALGGEAMRRETAELLRSVLFRPVLENGAFRKADVEIERRNLLDLIASQLNDKRTYAVNRLREEMCRDEAYGVNELGSREDVPGITPEALTQAWRKMLSGAPVEIFLIGPGAEGGAPECAELFRRAFESFGRTEPFSCPTEVRRTAGEVREVRETLPVAQAKIVMGLRAGTASPDPDVAAAQLAVTLLGGSPTSKFFMNVREKLSLCYYCMARYERVKGLVLFDAGIEQSNYDKARRAILGQLDELKAGRFTDDELRSAALYLCNVYRSLADSLESLGAWYLAGAVAGRLRTPAEAADEISGLSREDVLRAAGRMQLDTVYFLSGGKPAGGAGGPSSASERRAEPYAL